MSKSDDKVITGQWNGHKQYRCRLCAFDSLDKAAFEDHFAKVHAPLQVIEGRKAKAQNPETMTREELNAYATSVGLLRWASMDHHRYQARPGLLSGHGSGEWSRRVGNLIRTLLPD